MKRGLMLGFVLLSVLMLNLASAIEMDFSSATAESANMQIMSLKHEPYPVEPGEVFDLWVKVQNNGRETATNAACRLVLDNPFSIYQGELVQSWGVLNPGNTALFKYKLLVSNDAVDGDTELRIECTENPISGIWRGIKANITVQTRYPTLNIKSIKTEPSAIAPGRKADLVIVLENMADSSMKDIDIKIDFSNVPFAPYQEIGEKKLRRLNAGSADTLTFSIVAMPNAEGGIHKVPVEITYTDNIGTAHDINATISIEINSMPDLFFSVDTASQLTTSQKTGDISIKVTNRGLTNIKYFSMKMLPSRQIKMISTDTAYIGDVDSDDSEVADFRITAKSSKLIIPLEVSYRDVSNNPYIEQTNITYNLPSASETGKKGTNWILIIIVLIAIIFVYIKKKSIFGWIKSKF